MRSDPTDDVSEVIGATVAEKILSRKPERQAFLFFGIFRCTSRHGFEAWLSNNRHHEHDVRNTTTRVPELMPFYKAPIPSLLSPDGPNTNISNHERNLLFPSARSDAEANQRRAMESSRLGTA